MTSSARTHHEANLEEVRRDTHQTLSLSEQVKIKRTHSIVVGNPREEVHQDHLRISFSTIPRLLVFRFFWWSTFDDDDSWCSMSCDACCGANERERRESEERVSESRKDGGDENGRSNTHCSDQRKPSPDYEPSHHPQ